MQVRRALDEEVALDDAAGLNRRLRTFLRSDETYRKYLPTETWLSGGCWLLAEALRQVLSGTLVAIKSNHGVEHVLLRVGDWYVDGDGFSRRGALLRRWRVVEGITHPRLVSLDVEFVLVRGHMPPPDGRLPALVADLRRVLR